MVSVILSIKGKEKDDIDINKRITDTFIMIILQILLGNKYVKILSQNIMIKNLSNLFFSEIIKIMNFILLINFPRIEFSYIFILIVVFFFIFNGILFNSKLLFS